MLLVLIMGWVFGKCCWVFLRKVKRAGHTNRAARATSGQGLWMPLARTSGWLWFYLKGSAEKEIRVMTPAWSLFGMRRLIWRNFRGQCKACLLLSVNQRKVKKWEITGTVLCRFLKVNFWNSLLSILLGFCVPKELQRKPWEHRSVRPQRVGTQF